MNTKSVPGIQYLNLIPDFKEITRTEKQRITTTQTGVCSLDCEERKNLLLLAVRWRYKHLKLFVIRHIIGFLFDSRDCEISAESITTNIHETYTAHQLKVSHSVAQ